MQKYYGTLGLGKNQYNSIRIGWPLAFLATNDASITLKIWPYWTYKIDLSDIENIEDRLGTIDIVHHSNAPTFIRFGTSSWKKKELLEFFAQKNVPKYKRAHLSNKVKHSLVGLVFTLFCLALYVLLSVKPIATDMSECNQKHKNVMASITNLSLGERCKILKKGLVEFNNCALLAKQSSKLPFAENITSLVSKILFGYTLEGIDIQNRNTHNQYCKDFPEYQVFK